MAVVSRAMLLAMLTLGIVPIYSTATEHNQTNLLQENTNARSDSHHGAVSGRVVQIPARDYILAFGIEEPPKLGDCALKMEDGSIKTCTENFHGTVEFILRASTNMDASKVRSTEDIINQGTGSIGIHEGVLGLTGTGLKNKMAATFQRSEKQLTFMTSYDFQKAALTLKYSHPLTEINPEGALYLSEIELGGNEILMVTMEFESVEQKREIENTLIVSVLYKTISDKMEYIKDNFDSSYRTRVQFKSSWRLHNDHLYTSMSEAIAAVQRLEAMFVDGPTELNVMELEDPRIHNNYYFAAWNKSPYGANANMAAINNELETLSRQNLEVQSVIYGINELPELNLDLDKMARLSQLNNTLRAMNQQLTGGIQSYHCLTDVQKYELRDVYGDFKAPEYYSRQLKALVGY